VKSLYLAALALATSLSPASVSAAGLTAQFGLAGTNSIDQVNALRRDDGDRRGEHGNRDHGNRSQSGGNTEWQRGSRGQTEQRVQQPRQEQRQQQYRQEPRVQAQAQPQVQRNTEYRGQRSDAPARYERNDDRGAVPRYDRRREDRVAPRDVAPRYDRNNNGNVDRRYDQNRDGRVDRNYNNNNYRRSDNRNNDRSHNNWNRSWQNDRRYDWRSYRDNHRDYYRSSRYNAPYRNHYYSRLNIGFYLGNGFFGSNYWINDPSYYRLPPAYGAYRWVRYYDDVLLIDIRNGYVVDVVYDFFW
jgi:Nickel/cobalt transporter regulator